MSMSVGASSNALSYLRSLLAQGSAGAADAAGGSDPLSTLLQSLSGSGTSADPSTSTTGTGGPCCSPFADSTMAALIALQGQTASGVTAQSPSQLFSKLDTDGDGQISKAEFESALGGAGVDPAKADALFAKLDANGDGSISQSELAKARHGHHHHHHGGGEAQGNASSGQNALATLLSVAGANGATTQTTTNADGSTSTTISYADGSTVEMTTPAVAANDGGPPSGSTGAQNGANLLEQLIRLQSQLLAAATSTVSAIA